MASKQRMLHHVSFHFGKSRVLFSVPGTTTLLDLKRTLLTALPMLRSDASTSSSPPDLVSSETHTTSSSSLDSVCGTSDIVMWRRRGVEGMDRFGVADGDAQGPEGWVCLEGDPASFEEASGEEERGERRRVLNVSIGDQGRIPAWERWVDVYVSFRDGDSWPEPVVQHPSLDDGEYEEDA
ncbi:hypothetical protein NliqN6_6059 [Naganishia liquefaciens]|uniref:Uncharacterized protein n=1 Tax=Naganishia liquefaciens TaxID=104408 RepID=A0A8H3TYY1_9TREE|nr:hypothetical protein NliqN6_6059 [Naganishia liquefaciens]